MCILLCNLDIMCTVWDTFPGGCLSYNAPGWSLYKLSCWVGMIGTAYCCTAQALVRYIHVHLMACMLALFFIIPMLFQGVHLFQQVAAGLEIKTRILGVGCTKTACAKLYRTHLFLTSRAKRFLFRE